MAKLALEGVKILDFSWVGAGALITKCLADSGARVIRIESTHSPDITRTSPPFKDSKPGLNRSGYFPMFNTSKYSMALNMKNPLGVALAKKLVSYVDIVAESFAPGKMEEWEMSYEDLKKLKPDIIMLRCSNQGQTGPHATHPGFGTQLVGLSGFTCITGWPDLDPVQPHGGYTDFVSPPFAVAAIIAALYYRQKTGKGQYLDLSQLECGIQFLSPFVLDWFINNRQAVRMGNRSPWSIPHSVYRCRGEDRWCAIEITSDEEWQAFCEITGHALWAENPKFATALDRKRNEKELNELIGEWTCDLDAEEVMTLLQSVGVSAGIVSNSKNMLNDPQLKKRGYYSQLNHTEIGLLSHPGQPFILSETTVKPMKPAPCLGEDTEYVCRDILKMPDDEFIKLVQSGVFE